MFSDDYDEELHQLMLRLLMNMSADEHASDAILDNCTNVSDMDRFEEVGFWLEFVVLVTVAFVGLVGNCIAVPILLSKQLTNLFNRTLAFLALFDNAYLVCEILESIRQYRGPLSDFHVFLFPQVLYPLQNIAMVGSIYTTVVVAIERLAAVTKPINAYLVYSHERSWRRFWLHAAPVLAFAVEVNLPTFFEFRVHVPKPLGEFEFYSVAANHTDHKCSGTGTVQMCLSDLRVNPDYVFYYINLTRIPLTGLVPLLALCVLNFLVYKKLKARRKLVASMGIHNDIRNQLTIENRQARTLFGVAILFFVGHTLRIILNLHELLIFDKDADVLPAAGDCTTYWPFWSMVARALSRLLTTISSSANLLVYCVACASFRKVLRLKLAGALLYCFPKDHPVRRRHELDRRRQQPFSSHTCNSRRTSQFSMVQHHHQHHPCQNSHLVSSTVRAESVVAPLIGLSHVANGATVWPKEAQESNA